MKLSFRRLSLLILLVIAPTMLVSLSEDTWHWHRSRFLTALDYEEKCFFVLTLVCTIILLVVATAVKTGPRRAATPPPEPPMPPQLPQMPQQPPYVQRQYRPTPREYPQGNRPC